MKSTEILEKNLREYQSKEHRIVINEGGTGSSKTYSLAQMFALIMMRESGVQITIARKTFPSLRATSMKDFFSIIESLGIYQEGNHNKSEHTYNYHGNQVDFISVDEPMKIRSRRRNYLWMNEANEFDLEDYRQLSMRTDKQIFMDYNPSHQYHWIYDELQPRKDCVVITSTFRDNPFLPKELIKEIEGYKDKDYNYWRIYGLGLKGISESMVYTHWKFCESMPDSLDDVFYGLDFGYNNQTAIVKIAEKDKDYYWEEKLYQRYLTNTDLIEKMKKIDFKNSVIYADNAEPARIEELKRAGFNVVPCVKLEIKDGIDIIKSHNFYITKSSVNLLKEVKSYNWKERDGKLLEETVKENDHLLDGGRYAITTRMKSPRPVFSFGDRILTSESLRKKEFIQNISGVKTNVKITENVEKNKPKGMLPEVIEAPILNEEQRKKLEKIADLEIMNKDLKQSRPDL